MDNNIIELVSAMQKYILYLAGQNNPDFMSLYSYIGYSKRHADRCFKELIGRTPIEYYKLIKLSESAESIIDDECNIIDIAFGADYTTNEGFSKAFKKQFGILPSQYRSKKFFIPLFHYYPIKDYYNHLKKAEDNRMNNNFCMITPVHKENRKLIFLRSKKATEYFSFCEESGCDWEGLLNSNPYKLDTAALITLPDFLMKKGYTSIACGIEVPYDFSGQIPENFEIAELPECNMLYFQSQKYSNEEDYSLMISQVLDAVDNFNYKLYGYKVDNSIAPRFNFGAEKDTGARYAVPVIKIS